MDESKKTQILDLVKDAAEAPVSQEPVIPRKGPSMPESVVRSQINSGKGSEVTPTVDAKCGIKLVRKVIRQGIENAAAETFLASFDNLPPETAYRGGDIEFTFDDHAYKDRLITRNPELKNALMRMEKEQVSLPLASIMESKPELFLAPVNEKSSQDKDKKPALRFNPMDLAADMRNIKKVLSESFTEFQRERYSHLNEEGITDQQARRMALSVFMQKIPSVAASSARFQVMLQGSEEERDLAAAAIMEAWSSAFADYRAAIDNDISGLTTEQLQKIADGYRTEAADQFKKASAETSKFLMDYQNDLGFVFLAAFCPPLFFIAVIPLLLPFAKAAYTGRKAYAEERKISGIHRKIDERIEIATAATVSRGVVSDWIECNLKGVAPEFMRQINESDGDGYLDKLTERHVRIRDMVGSLFKNNFEKTFTVGSGEHQKYEGECRQISHMLEQEFGTPLMDVISDSLSSYKKVLKTITKKLPDETVDGNVSNKEIPVSERILGLLNSLAEPDENNTHGTSLFDIYKGYTLEDFGAMHTGSQGEDSMYKGEASALSLDQLTEFVKYKAADDLNKFQNAGYTCFRDDGVTPEAVDIDMRLRSMVSYDTLLARRDSHQAHAGLDFLDAAFGFEHLPELKEKAFWGELEKTEEFKTISADIGKEGMDLFKRLVISCGMAESYDAQLTNIRKNGDEFYNLPGTAVVHCYYRDAAKDITDLTSRIGEKNLSLFSEACRKTAEKNTLSAKEQEDNYLIEKNKMEERYVAVKSDMVAQRAFLNNIKKQQGEESDEYKKATEELVKTEKLAEDIKNEMFTWRAENRDIYLANEIAARTAQKYIEQIRQGTYREVNENKDREFSRIYSIDSKNVGPLLTEGQDDKLKKHVLDNYMPLSLAGNETSLTAANEAMALININSGRGDSGWDTER